MRKITFSLMKFMSFRFPGLKLLLNKVDVCEFVHLYIISLTRLFRGMIVDDEQQEATISIYLFIYS